MYYVSAVDKFLSGWGPAKGKKSVLVFECDNTNEAKIVMNQLNSRTDMTEVKRYKAFPVFLDEECIVQVNNKESAPNFYNPEYQFIE